MSCAKRKMNVEGLATALEDIASAAVRRDAHDVYRFAMSALGHLLADPARHWNTAVAVLDGCRIYLSKQARA